jgi:hypothetical protein
VAVAGSTVIEVHQVGTGEGPLSYHAAEIRANGSVVWAKKGFQYDSGFAPSVSASGPTIIEVHQVVSGVGALWYHMADRNRVGRSNSQPSRSNMTAVKRRGPPWPEQ